MIKDIKGRNIREGDAVRIIYDEPYSLIPANFAGTVVFREGKWQVDDGSKTVDLWQEIAQWEIVERG